MTARPSRDEGRDAGWDDSLLVWNATVARIRVTADALAPVERAVDERTAEPSSDTPSAAPKD